MDIIKVILQYILMSQVSSSQNLKEKGANTSRSSEEDQAPVMEQRGQRTGKNSRLYSIVIVIVLIAMGMVVYWRSQHSPIKYNQVEFDFHVYCPMSYEPGIPDSFKGKFPFLNQTYVVSIQEHYHDNNKDQSYYFCGLARTWDGSCKDAKYICSQPGPVFDVKAFEEVVVVWRNEIDQLNESLIFNAGSMADCYNSTKEPKPERCFVEAKTENWEQCTYKDPTQVGKEKKIVQINKKSIPISTHLHGLEVRPVYDGNPLSWHSNQGKGVGFLSAQMKYFQDNKLLQLIDQVYSRNSKHTFKVNVYKNTQLPGSLWYHDHAMGTTGLNVKKGLNGMYLIRTDESEAALPTREYSKILLINSASLRNPRAFIMRKEENMKKNATYRFRILNSDFDAHYENISFVHSCNPLVNDSKCVDIPFTVIGADSALRKTPLSGVITFRLASAERIDLLVRFPDLADQSNVYLYDSSKSIIFAVMNINGFDTTQDYTIPTQLPVSFQDLTDESPVRKRMRPLFFYAPGSDFRLSINGHPTFHGGKSENPQIGTIEDWYFINTMAFPHPIHVHLINYQLVKEYSLKKVNENITYYHCDFFLEYAALNDSNCNPNSTYFKYQQKYQNGEDLTYDEYKNIAPYLYSITTDQAKVCFANFANEHDFINGVSGVDLHRQCSSGNCHNEYKNQTCSLLSSRYICKDTTDQLYEYEKGWKEVGLTRKMTALVARIRWTKTDFENKTNEPYFHLPERQLIEFPGFVYHCHFLPHEDNEMMRPIMMQSSDKHPELNWNQLYSSINDEIGCKSAGSRGDLRK